MDKLVRIRQAINQSRSFCLELTSFSDPPPRPRFRHPAAGPEREIPRETALKTRQPSTPGRRSPSPGRIHRHRLQNRQSGDVDHALPHRLPRRLRPGRADLGAPAGCSSHLALGRT